MGDLSDLKAKIESQKSANLDVDGGCLADAGVEEGDEIRLVMEHIPA